MGTLFLVSRVVYVGKTGLLWVGGYADSKIGMQNSRVGGYADGQNRKCVLPTLVKK